jgi:hypothetical protein
MDPGKALPMTAENMLATSIPCTTGTCPRDQAVGAWLLNDEIRLRWGEYKRGTVLYHE